MTPETGEVYYDDVFNWEITIVSVEKDVLYLDDPVEEGEVREYKKFLWEHNISVGRFEKVRDGEDVKEIDSTPEEKKGIFSY